MTTYKNIKYCSWKFIVFLFFVLVFGRGSSLVVNFDPRLNLLGSIIYISCLIYMYNCCKKSLIVTKSPIRLVFWTTLFIWLSLHVFIIDGGFPIIIYGQFILHFIAGILIIKSYKNDITVYFEKTMVLISAISIVFWIVEMLGGHYLLHKSPILLENIMGNSQYSILLYTLGNVDTMSGGLWRNSGCAWEPGLYSIMLSMAILFNIYHNNGIRLNKRFFILLIALITTFSTTGYIIAMIIFACYFMFSKKNRIVHKIIYIIIFGIPFFFIYQLPFMSSKIEQRGQVENFTTNSGAMEWYEKEDIIYTPDRFEGIYLDYLNFLANPIIGYGIQREKSFVYNNISPYIITSNGIVKSFAQYGFILGIIFLILTYKSCNKLGKLYSFNSKWMLFVVIIIGSVSYMFDSTPIMRAIELYALYNLKNV